MDYFVKKKLLKLPIPTYKKMLLYTSINSYKMCINYIHFHDVWGSTNFHDFSRPD